MKYQIMLLLKTNELYMVVKNK